MFGAYRNYNSCTQPYCGSVHTRSSNTASIEASIRCIRALPLKLNASTAMWRYNMMAHKVSEQAPCIWVCSVHDIFPVYPTIPHITWKYSNNGPRVVSLVRDLSCRDHNTMVLSRQTERNIVIYACHSCVLSLWLWVEVIGLMLIVVPFVAWYGHLWALSKGKITITLFSPAGHGGHSFDMLMVETHWCLLSVLATCCSISITCYYIHWMAFSQTITLINCRTFLFSSDAVRIQICVYLCLLHLYHISMLLQGWWTM